LLVRRRRSEREALGLERGAGDEHVIDLRQRHAGVDRVIEFVEILHTRRGAEHTDCDLVDFLLLIGYGHLRVSPER
jgi:hypothetical protein